MDHQNHRRWMQVEVCGCLSAEVCLWWQWRQRGCFLRSGLPRRSGSADGSGAARGWFTAGWRSWWWTADWPRQCADLRSYHQSKDLIDLIHLIDLILSFYSINTVCNNSVDYIISNLFPQINQLQPRDRPQQKQVGCVLSLIAHSLWLAKSDWDRRHVRGKVWLFIVVLIVSKLYKRYLLW